MRSGSDIAKATSNTDFARRVGIHFTMASRLRNGKRIPSAITLAAIQDAFELTPRETHEMIQAAVDPRLFGEWVERNLYEPRQEGHGIAAQAS